MGFEIIGTNYSKGSEGFEKFRDNVDKIIQKTERVKAKYGLESTKMSFLAQNYCRTEKYL